MRPHYLEARADPWIYALFHVAEHWRSESAVWEQRFRGSVRHIVQINQSGKQRQWLDEAELKFLILSLQRQLKALKEHQCGRAIGLSWGQDVLSLHHQHRGVSLIAEIVTYIPTMSCLDALSFTLSSSLLFCMFCFKRSWPKNDKNVPSKHFFSDIVPGAIFMFCCPSKCLWYSTGNSPSTDHKIGNRYFTLKETAVGSYNK